MSIIWQDFWQFFEFCSRILDFFKKSKQFGKYNHHQEKVMRIISLLFIFFISCFYSGCQNVKLVGEIPMPLPAVLPDYTVQPGDSLKIVVWQKPDFSQQVMVHPNGKIRLLLLGEMPVEGKTLTQIHKDISTRLREYVKEPVVEVSLASFNFGIYIFGEVGKPGVIPVTQNTTILKAIILSGGLRPYADKANVVIMREIPGKQIRYRFNLSTYLSGEDLQQNIYLQPGDKIFVPALPF